MMERGDGILDWIDPGRHARSLLPPSSTTSSGIIQQHQQHQQHQQQQQQRHVSVRKTGTTIAGLVGRDFCLLAADTRATVGMTVADLRAEKLHPLLVGSNTNHNNHQESSSSAAASSCCCCWAAGAGTSADLQHLTQECRFTFQLWQQQYGDTIGNGGRFNNNNNNTTTATSTLPSGSSVCQWLRRQLYQRGGSCQANLIVGGICPQLGRPFLRAIHPHGSMDHDDVTFAALGSGGLAAMAVLESSLLSLSLLRHKSKDTSQTTTMIPSESN